MQITLCDARLMAGLTIDEAANFAGISVKALSQFEADNRSMEYDLVLKLCRLYGTSLDHLHVGLAPEPSFNGAVVGRNNMRVVTPTDP